MKVSEGQKVLALSFENDKLVEVGTIVYVVELTDLDENAYKVWYSEKEHDFDYINSNEWDETRQSWIVDKQTVIELGLL